MHYRVPIYNYFYRRFKEYDWEFIVRSNEIQNQNKQTLEFNFKEIGFKFKKYKEEIENIKPDVVILFLHHKDLIYWPMVHLLKFKKIPVVYWNKAINHDDPNNKMRYQIFKYMHNISDSIILYSKHEIKYIKEKNRYKVHIANNTINFEDFPVIKESKKQIKEEFNIPFEKVVLSVGRMGSGGQRKKIDHLIEIFNGMKTKNVGLVIVGSGMNNGLLKKMNQDNIIYLGEIHDPHHIQISKLFKMADLFSIPGHVGLGLNQAFYWGLPVVTEDGLQPPEIHYLVNGRNGFIVPNNDLGELKEKILYLLEHDEIRKEFSRNAKADIIEQASINNMYMGFKKCIESLV